jgi:uncharacterized membrane protein YbhN (UPF0104 family)
MASSTPLAQQLQPIRRRSLTIRWLRYLAPLVLIGLAIHILLPQLGDLEKSWSTIRQMPWWLVGLAVAAQMASYAGSGYLLHALAAMLQQHLSVLRGVVITLASGSIGLVAGGIVGNSAATYRWTVASGVSGQAAGLCGTLPSLLNNVLLALLALVGTIHLMIVHELTAFQMIAFGTILVSLVALVAGGIWGVTHPAWLLKVVTRFDKRWAAALKRPYAPDETRDRVNQVVNMWVVLRNGGWRGPALGAVLNTGFDMLTLYFLFIAAAHAVGPGVLLTGYGLPLLLGKVSFLPGGVGIVEGTMTAIYASTGVPLQVTAVVILAYRLISFWIPTLLGFPAAFYLQHAFGKA